MRRAGGFCNITRKVFGFFNSMFFGKAGQFILFVIGETHAVFPTGDGDEVQF